jgi:hypothetical protein
MDWLEPWWPTDQLDEHFHDTFRRQLEREVSPGHCLHQVPVRLLARGSGDDALFRLLDGSDRVAGVHLTWSSAAQSPPWPRTVIYPTLEEWSAQVMIPEHREWAAE